MSFEEGERKDMGGNIVGGRSVKGVIYVSRLELVNFILHIVILVRNYREVGSIVHLLDPRY